MAPVPRPGILEISPYVGGESHLPGIAKAIKLASNESALGTSPRALAAYHAAADRGYIYPDGHCVELRRTLAARNGLDFNRIVCGAGSDDVLLLLGRAYAGPGDEVVISRHGFSLYPLIALGAGATPVVAEEVDLTSSVDNLLAAVTERTRLVIIANPNNPTGSYISADEMKRLHAGLPESTILVIDSAYAEYVGRNDYSTGSELVDAHPNVVMTRTFSKIYGMGGMRLGWAYCPAAIADVLNRIRAPFNVSTAAMEAGKAALEDTEFLNLARAHNDYWLPWMNDELQRLGIAVAPSVANFVLARFGSAERAQAANDYLRRAGIIVRAMGGYGLPDSLRITIGRDTENRALIAALSDFVGK